MKKMGNFFQKKFNKNYVPPKIENETPGGPTYEPYYKPPDQPD